MASTVTLGFLERRLSDVEEDVTTLYGQFCLINEFLQYKFGEEYADFAKEYVTNGSLNQLRRKGGDRDRITVPESVTSSSNTTKIGFRPEDEDTQEERTIVISNVRSLCPDYRNDAEVDLLDRRDGMARVKRGQMLPIKGSKYTMKTAREKDSGRKKISINNKKAVTIATPVSTVEKKHECISCGKNFRLHSTLVDHIKIHKNKKEFDCPYCGRVFHQASALEVHERFHTNQ